MRPFCCNFPTELLDRLRTRAEQRRIPISNLIREFVEDTLDELDDADQVKV